MELLIRNTELHAFAKRIFLGIASEAELASAKADDVYAIKKEGGVPRFTSFAGKVERVAKTKETDRKRRFVASSERPDRMGDVIRVSGWSFKNFENNPISLWGHDSNTPVGTVSDWTKSSYNGSKVLKETIDFAPADVTPAGEAALRLVDGGVVRATSVGFMPLENGVRVPDESERKAEGMTPYGVIYEKQDQLELTLCSIPCHPDALQLKALGLDQVAIDDALWDMAEKGIISDSVAESLTKAMGSGNAEKRIFVSMSTPAKKVIEEIHTADHAADNAPHKVDEPIVEPNPNPESKTPKMTCPSCGTHFDPDDVNGVDPNEPDADDKSAESKVDTLSLVIDALTRKYDALELEVVSLREQINKQTPSVAKPSAGGSKEFYASLFAEVAKGV